MNCQNCQQALAADAAFCPRCGAAVAPVPQADRDLKPKRGRGRALAGAAGVFGLVAMGFVGLRLARSVGSDYVGGASSPEGAVEELVDAINAEDVLGALSFVAPDEIDGVADVVESLIDTLDAGVGGIGDGTEADVELETSELSAHLEGDHAAIVEFEIAGGVERTAGTGPVGVSLPTSTSFDPDELEDLFPGSGDDVQLVVVELGGNWYVSPMLSFGNYVTEARDLPTGDFDRVGEQRDGGGSDPEDAVDQMFDAIADFDVDALAESLGGGEGRFATVFADAIEDLVDEIPSDVTLDLDTRLSSLDGGRVEVEEVEGVASDSYDVVEFEAKNDCVSVTDEYDTDRTCLLGGVPFETRVDDTIVLDTVDEDGATRVRLVPTVSELGSRLLAASSRQLLLYAVGMEWADTAVAVPAGSDTDIDFDGSLYAVHTFEAPADSRFHVDTEDSDFEVWTRVEGQAWEHAWGSSIELPEAASVRVVTYSEVDCNDGRCFPSGDGSDTLRVRAVPRQAAEFPAILSGELGSGDQILFDLTVTDTQTLRIDLMAGVDVYWETTTGDWGRLGDDLYEMEPGMYGLVVGNRGQSTETYELVPRTQQVGFDGSSTTTRSLDSGSFSAEVMVTPGSWVVAATPSADQDIVLSIADADCWADETADGGAERCYFDASAATTVQIEVEGYRSSDEFGTVLLRLD